MLYMRTTTIRVTSETRDRLNALARRRGAPVSEIVAELAQEADERALLEDAAEGWERLADDPEALAAYRAESQALEGFEPLLPEHEDGGVKPLQGSVAWADPEPTPGREQAKARPFVIVSVDQLNRSPLALSLAVPLTRTDFGNALSLAIDPPEGGLRERERSYAMPEQLRALSHERIARRMGSLRPATLAELLRRCRLLLTEAP